MNERRRAYPPYQIWVALVLSQVPKNHRRITGSRALLNLERNLVIARDNERNMRNCRSGLLLTDWDGGLVCED